MACLDTTVLIDLAGNKTTHRAKALAKIEEISRRKEALFTTRFNLAELYVGAARSSKQAKEEKIIQDLLGFMQVLEFDDRAARFFGEITAYLQVQGKPSGDMDVLIAAVCLAGGQSLVTRNIRHYENIPNLVVEDY